MKIKKLQKASLILLIIASLAVVLGVSMTTSEGRSTSRLNANITSKTQCFYNQSNSSYQIDYKYQIRNNSTATWTDLTITTTVYDQSGTKLGTLTANFNNIEIKPGDLYTKDISFIQSNPDDFFATLYNSSFSSLRFDSSVTWGRYK